MPTARPSASARAARRRATGRPGTRRPGTHLHTWPTALSSAPAPVRVASTERVSRNNAGGSGQSGMASYYGTELGSQTASGARFNPSAMTAAHRSLPFGTKVRVTNKRNGRSVVVTINDRGPFVRGRIIDLSTGAAGVIGMRGAGVAPVSLEVLGRG